VRPKSKEPKGPKRCPGLVQGPSKSFDHVKATIAKEVVFAYPDYSKVLKIYTDASSKKLGAVITQDNRPIAFFSGKFSTTQRKYIFTKIQLLDIIKTSKEFKGMLWGQSIKVYHHYLQHPGHSRLEETIRSVMYWKGMHNTIRKYVKCCRS
jgi:hypothetical protein